MNASPDSPDFPDSPDSANSPDAPYAPGTVAVPPGYRIGEWEVTGFLAAGSWGSVHLARRIEPAAPGEPTEAALKFLSTAGLAPRQARALAETADREVAFSRSAAHPHVIQIYDTAVVSDPEEPALDGAVVLVMERAERSLLDLFADASGYDADAVLLQLAGALAHLHESGWVHGDLKPGNVLLMADGSVRLADFGLATQLEGTHGYAPPLGSPDYLPPERRTEEVSHRGVLTRPATDVWAFGITAHQALTNGGFPFAGATPVSRGAAVQEYAADRARLRLDPEVSELWRAVLADCLSADPAVRAGHTMRSLLPRIEEAAAHGAPRGRGPLRRRLRGRVVAAVVAVVVLAAVAGGLGLLWPFDSARAAATVHVYNIDGNCKAQTERVPACSLGLARDPHRKYDGMNVVTHRVWHGDALETDCVVNDGDRVEDELGVGTPRWYKIRLDDVPEGYGWLPAVRTRDDPGVPVCPAASPG
ncbi:serine/threonine-protein kinase [Streptomyces sp. NPDC060031]|uniref:serine/threonine-protein kinase n=1 Tax=Streptomyces sp. NPDC060031 TaxID=3347043 RepID=UPI0036C23B07